MLRGAALLLALLRAAPAAGGGALSEQRIQQHTYTRRTLLVSHFYNEALLLPYWIAHHAPMFSSAILIDYNSTDGSAELVRQLAPRTWKVVPSRDGAFDAVTLDQQVKQWEMSRPEDWRIALTTTEFLVMPAFHKQLAEFDALPKSSRVLHFHSLIAMGDDTIPLKPPSAEPLVCQRSVFVEPQRGLLLGASPNKPYKPFYDRFMHAGLGRAYEYEVGRHALAPLVRFRKDNEAYHDGGIILKTPWPETRSRKMQIGHKVPQSDIKISAGMQHVAMMNLSTRAADEKRDRALEGVAKYDATGKGGASGAPTAGGGGGGALPAVPALALSLLRRWACGKGLQEDDGGAGGGGARALDPTNKSHAMARSAPLATPSPRPKQEAARTRTRCAATRGAAPSVAVIGAGGNVGARLHEVLAGNCGWKVTGYDREPQLHPPRAKYPITPMSAASIPSAELAAYDAVVYLGGLTGRAACDRHTRAQNLAENVDDPLALASRMGPSQLLVFASTSAIAEGSGLRSMREDEVVRTELLDSYSSSMYERELVMRQLAASKPAGAPQLVGLRFGTVIGVSPGQRVGLGPPAMLKSAYTTGVLKVAHPETSRAFLWLEDLCRGISRAIELRRGGGASVGAPPATAHHSKRASSSSSSMAPAAWRPFAIYHLSSFNSNVGALAAAIAARTGARIAASNHGDASKDVLGFSLDNSLFLRTYNFTIRGSLATAINRLDGAVPDSLIGKGAHTTAVHVPPAADEPTPTDAACDGRDHGARATHERKHEKHEKREPDQCPHARPPPAANRGGVSVTSIRCPVCGSHDIQLTLDLHDQPLANDFMKTTAEALRAEKFPLALVRCRRCHHLHLSQLVSRKRLFSDYLYVSGTSKTLLKHFEWLARKIQADVETLPLEGTRTKRAVLELACNDGSQLDAFARLGWKTYGVDPAANIVPTAVAKGHQVKVGFWGAQSVWPPAGKPVVLDAIVAQNVLAHVPSPTQFLKDCAAAMGPRTLLFIQTSQCHMHEDGQFDTAYHEHLSFFTSHSFEHAATAAQLAVLSFETAPIHGISCLWKLKRADGASSGALASGTSLLPPYPLTSLQARLDEEVRLGITTDFFYDRYRMRAEETSAWLDAQLAALSAAGYRLGGYGAAAKGMVLLHFMLGRGGAHAAARALEFVLDDAPMKQGTYCPGTSIPVRPTRSLADVFAADEKPLALVMFAWNFWAELSGNVQKLLAAAPPTRSGRPRVVLAVLPFPTPRVVTLQGDTVAQMHYKPAQIDAAVRGWVRADGGRRALLVTSFADDAAVLPHWIRHHAHMFDEATLLDCGSADASRGIIEREAPPTWRVVPVPNASSCADHLASHAGATPHDWVFPLQLHELLVHGDLRGALDALDVQVGTPPAAATLQFPALQMAGPSTARAPADRFTDLATQRSQYHAVAPPATFRAKTGAEKLHAKGRGSRSPARTASSSFTRPPPPTATATGAAAAAAGRRRRTRATSRSCTR